ncbi:GGDEF domain-containing protein [Chromobacterium sp. IIBBL 290-4]|uniref:GGDEF domain-containing protein n=1 Tax=Chromobacterium sp. IIBBL 290-4 TaxID=2953890 RepID=UPI0020B6A0BD|nr:GGDEF domain-containing protein [Chromobacterium sp. IIBBL 290-4]UTH74917.1 GGDEF domain-containing protein [Chromobacterium sp. IIBBL 290-4]
MTSHLPQTQGDSAEETEWLNGLVELTSQREPQAMTRRLVALLLESLPISEAKLLVCRPADAGSELSESWRGEQGGGIERMADAPRRPASAELLAWLSGGAGEALEADGGLYKALHCQQRLFGLLFVSVRQATPRLRADFISLARIYENYLGLLAEADCDRLTGLQNRRKFDQRIYQLLEAQALQSLEPSVLAMLDIDLFKHINDQFGHSVGDQVLQELAQLLLQHCRPEDGVYRVGGEEFAILLPNVGELQGEAMLQALRLKVIEHRFVHGEQLSISIGYAMTDIQLLPVQLLDQADRALYFIKSHGRNQVLGYQALADAGKVNASMPSGDIELF